MPKAKSKSIDSFELHLPKEVRSLNKTLKQHWSVRVKDKEEWYMLLKSEALLSLDGVLRSQPEITFNMWLVSKKHITITRIMGPRQREFDDDNMVGGCKSLRDATIGLIIKEDTRKYVHFKYKQVKGERGETIIKVRFGV